MIRRWIQNEYADNVNHWRGQGELPAHAFRKSYLPRWWDTDWVEVGPPQATEHVSEGGLLLRGIVGLYGYRREGS